MKKTQNIMFLTNSDNSLELLEWLVEQGETVIKYEEPITVEVLKKNEPYMLISYNYRHMIKSDVIEYMNGKIVNLHISFLPYNRGASPNFFSFIEDTPKGVSIHVVDEGLDTGPILVQKQMEFDDETESLSSSYEKLQIEIQELFKKNWSLIKEGKIIPQKQVGVGSYHRTADLLEWKKKIEFQWTDTIKEIKQRIKNKDVE